jgi:hydrogenase nickel incorporation protein HypB
MCATCGCSEDSHAELTRLDPGHAGHTHEHSDRAHAHTHGDDGHAHEHGHPPSRMVQLEHDVMAKNDRAAEQNRGWLASRQITAVNLMSSPGSGKTTLLEQTIRAFGDERSISVIEGDQATLLDAERIRATGRPVVQVNTGAGCHLDAEMIARSLRQLVPANGSLLLIENVGNLVCPALFDLGEQAKVVVMSVTEGEDKPLKYPHIFRDCALMLLNKIDLLPHLQFDLEKCIGNARRVNPRLQVVKLSATRGDGLDDWCRWLRAL